MMSTVQCRVCLSENDCTHNIFLDKCSNGQLYAEALTSCLDGIAIIQNDAMPSHICKACVSGLESWITCGVIDLGFVSKYISMNASIKVEPESENCPQVWRTDISTDVAVNIKTEEICLKTEPDDEYFRIDIDKKPNKRDHYGKIFRQDSGLWKYLKEHIREKPYKSDQSILDSQLSEELLRTVQEDGNSFIADIKTEEICVKTEPDNEIIQTSIDEKEMKPFDHRDSKAHRHIGTDEKPYQCDQCERAFRHEKMFIRHLRQHTRVHPYECDHCGKTFYLKTILTEHLRTHTGEKPYECDRCSKTFRQKSGLWKHSRKHTGEKPHECDRCGKTFGAKTSLSRHLQTHAGENLYRPLKTEQKYVNSSAEYETVDIKTEDICLKTEPDDEHIRTDVDKLETGSDEMKPFVCNLCEISFVCSDDLKAHQCIDTDEKPYLCDRCGKTFFVKYTLIGHLRTHSDIKLYECDRCGKTFCHKFTLTEHLRTHSGEKPYKCDRCEKTFCQKSSLWKHIRTHTGEKPYECDDCGKAFGQKYTLTKHLRTHTGIKPYNCNRCGKSFSVKSYLMQHLQTHASEKSYRCERCGKMFCRKSLLKKHLQTHTDEKPYECDHCGKAFSLKSYLVQHLQTHSGEMPYKSDKSVIDDRLSENVSRTERKYTRYTEMTDTKTEEIFLKMEPDDEYFQTDIDKKEMDRLEMKPFEDSLCEVSFALNDDSKAQQCKNDTDKKSYE